jgi:hypothetical protein
VQPRKRSAGFGGGLDDERARYRGERERPRDKAESFRGERKRGTRAAEATAEQVRERRKFSVDGRNLRAWDGRVGVKDSEKKKGKTSVIEKQVVNVKSL